MIRKFKIAGLPTDKAFAGMVFGRQIEHLRAIEAFKATAKSVHISQKRRTNAAAIREAVTLYGAKQYYCQFEDSSTCRDDSFQFWYI
jgi:hypothetical protein